MTSYWTSFVSVFYAEEEESINAQGYVFSVDPDPENCPENAGNDYIFIPSSFFNIFTQAKTLAQADYFPAAIASFFSYEQSDIDSGDVTPEPTLPDIIPAAIAKFFNLENLRNDDDNLVEPVIAPSPIPTTRISFLNRGAENIHDASTLLWADMPIPLLGTSVNDILGRRKELPQSRNPSWTERIRLLSDPPSPPSLWSRLKQRVFSFFRKIKEILQGMWMMIVSTVIYTKDIIRN